MTPRIIQTGRDNWQPRPPMSEARRQHIHGHLIPMDYPRQSFWKRLFKGDSV